MSFWGRRIKRDRADTLFSLYIRKRDKWKCQRCGKQHPENSGTLQCSHFWGRAKESTRYDPSNCDSLCAYPCHDNWEHEKGQTVGEVDGRQVILPREYRAWKINQLGPDRFAALEVRAHQTVKKDRKMSLLRVKMMLKALEEGN